MIDTNLYNSIPDTDVRKKWFTETDEKGEQYEFDSNNNEIQETPSLNKEDNIIWRYLTNVYQ